MKGHSCFALIACSALALALLGGAVCLPVSAAQPTGGDSLARAGDARWSPDREAGGPGVELPDAAPAEFPAQDATFSSGPPVSTGDTDGTPVEGVTTLGVTPLLESPSGGSPAGPADDVEPSTWGRVKDLFSDEG